MRTRTLISFCQRAISLFCFLAIFPAQAAEYPKNIIFIIGDGMGLSQISAALTTNPSLSLAQFPVIGLVKTHSDDKLVTDSAAAATALASGYKTRNKAIGIDSRGQAVKNLTEYAEEQAMLTGLVVTSRITHATPAAFAAHVDHREKETEIAEQLAQGNIDILFGGGRDMFLPQSTPGSQRSDNKNLLDKLAKTHQLANDREDFIRLNNTQQAVALLDLEALPRASQRRVSLAQMAAKAIELLSDAEQGFFLLIEGSQIDWGGHRNDAAMVLEETLDLDLAVATALKFARQNSDTLLLVTADHETGGYALEKGSIREGTVAADFTSRQHTGTLVPLFALGPGADKFSGIYDNTEIGKRLIQFITDRATQ